MNESKIFRASFKYDLEYSDGKVNVYTREMNNPALGEFDYELQWSGSPEAFIGRLLDTTNDVDDDDIIDELLKDRSGMVLEELNRLEDDGDRLQDFHETLDEVLKEFYIADTEEEIARIITDFWNKYKDEDEVSE
jgi:hypothetical protein